MLRLKLLGMGLFFVVFASPVKAAAPRIIQGKYDKQDTAALNLNMKDISADDLNTVHQTSTETIRGFKTFSNTTTFSSGLISTTATITTLTVQTISSGGNALSIQGSWDGWIASTMTATRLGNSSFTITADWTGVIQKGDKLRYVDSSSTEYAYVTAVAFTASLSTVTFTSGTDYALGASPSAWAYSKVASPQGFPFWFNYTPTYQGLTGAVTTNVARFHIAEQECYVQASFSGTSNASTMTITSPITNGDVSNGSPDTPSYVLDNGTWDNNVGPTRIRANSAVIDIGRNGNTIAGAAYNGFTTSGAKGATVNIHYKL